MSARTEIEIVESKSLDPEKVLHYMKNILRPFYSTSILDWKYSNTKEANTAGLFFMLNENKIISSQGFIPIRLWIEGKSVKSAKSESSFLSSEYRWKGLFEEPYFKSIEGCKSSDIDIFWSFTMLVKIWKEKLGFNLHNILYESRLQLSLRIN